MHELDEAERIERVYATRARTVPARNDSLLHDGNLFIAQERARLFLRELRRHDPRPLAQQHILEVGCGTGAWLRELVHWGADPAQLCGVDLLRDRLERARERLPAAVTLRAANATGLPFADGRFDLVLQSTVFSSILDGGLRRRAAAEMMRVTRAGGLIVWYDARVDSPGNRDFAGVPRRQIAALFADCRLHFSSLTLAPPLTRWLAPRSTTLCQLLAALPWLRTHWLVFMRTPS